MHARRRVLGLTVILFGLIPTALSAAVYELTAVADTSLYHDGSTAFDNISDGAGQHIWTSTTAGGVVRRALLRFDLSSIPAGSQVTSVRLSIFETRSRTDHPVSMHRLTAGWGEAGSNGGDAGVGAPAQPGDATWINRLHPSTPWISRGGDFVAAVSAVTTVSGGPAVYTWGSTPALVADVQTWLDAPPTNHGWILIGDEVTQQSAKRFSSRQSDPSVRPKLVVEASLPAAVADADVPLPLWALALCAAALGGGVAARSRAARRRRPMPRQRATGGGHGRMTRSTPADCADLTNPPCRRRHALRHPRPTFIPSTAGAIHP